jgi:hypothetical protein
VTPSRESDSRYAVEWFVPGTMIGDGRPLNGATFIEARDVNAAWDDFERRPLDPDRSGGRHGTAEVVRVARAEDLRDLPPLRDLIDAQGLR